MTYTIVLVVLVLCVFGTAAYADRCEPGTLIIPSVTFAGVSPVEGKVTVILNQPVNAVGIAVDVDNYLDPTYLDGVHCAWTGTPPPTAPNTKANSLCNHSYPGATIFTWMCPQDSVVTASFEDHVLCPGGDDPNAVLSTTIHPIPESIEVVISPSAIPRDKCHEATATITVYGYNHSPLQCSIRLDITSAGVLFKNGTQWVNTAQLNTDSSGVLLLQVRSADASAVTTQGSLTARYETVADSGLVTLGGLTIDLTSDKEYLVTLATQPPQRATITAEVGYGGQTACGEIEFITSHGKFENNGQSSYTRQLSNGVATAILITDPQQTECIADVTCRMDQVSKQIEVPFHQPALETTTSLHQVKGTEEVTCSARVFDAHYETDPPGVAGVLCNFHWAFPVNQSRQQSWATDGDGDATDTLNALGVEQTATGQLQVNAASYYGRSHPLKWHPAPWYAPSNISAVYGEASGMVEGWKVQFGDNWSAQYEKVGEKNGRWTVGIGIKY